MQSTINNEFNEHIIVANETMNSISKSIEAAAKICIDSLKKGNKILLIGNGGSAADAQHIAAEIVGRYKNDRKGLPAIALTTDTSILTSVSNDFDYSYVFERQLESLGNNGDVLIAISTGGSSTNVVNALKIAKKLGCRRIGFSGKGGGEFNSLCEVNLEVIATDTPRIQEMHILFGHIICHLIDQAFI